MPEDVFDELSIKTLAGIPVTNAHPEEPLNADNTNKYLVGFSGDSPQKIDEFIKSTFTITDGKTIKDIMVEGKEEVSCGYFCDSIEAPGIWNGLEYDAIQKNIRYNHIAVVDRGRAGPKVRIKLDSADAVLVEDSKKSSLEFENDINSEKSVPKSFTKEEKITMAKITIDSVEYEVSESLAQIVSTKISKIDSLGKEIESAKKNLDELSGKSEALSAELKKRDDEIKELKEKKLSDKEILARADELNSVVEFAKETLGDAFNADQFDIAKVKKEIVQSLNPEMNLDGKSEAWLDGAFDVAMENRKVSRGDALKNDLSNAVGGKGGSVNCDDARTAMMKRDAELWTKTENK